jgi:hypothetical protein
MQLKPNVLPKVAELLTFLRHRSHILETVELATKSTSRAATQGQHNTQRKSNFRPNALVANTNKCSFCSQTNTNTNTKKAGLCINCLRNDHSANECKSGVCRQCQRKHHTLLHFEKRCATPGGTESEDDGTTQLEATNSLVVNSNQALLSTVVVNILDASNAPIRCRADFLVVPKVTGHIPNASLRLTSRQLDIPAHVELADPQFHTPQPIDLPIGAEIFFEVWTGRQLHINDALPPLQGSVFGWEVAGRVSNNLIITNQPQFCGLLTTSPEGLPNPRKRFNILEGAANRSSSTVEKEKVALCALMDESGRLGTTTLAPASSLSPELPAHRLRDLLSAQPPNSKLRWHEPTSIPKEETVWPQTPANVTHDLLLERVRYDTTFMVYRYN